MSRDQSFVGFGIAYCPDNPDGYGVIVSRYDNIPEESNRMYAEQARKQQTTDANEIDMTAFVPCPKDFNADRETPETPNPTTKTTKKPKDPTLSVAIG